MKVVNFPMRLMVRDVRRCEHCQHPQPEGCDPAHIFSRGAGGPDLECNLVALCRRCHDNNHMGHDPDRMRLLFIAARRMKTTPEAITRLVYFFRNLRSDLAKDHVLCKAEELLGGETLNLFRREYLQLAIPEKKP